MLISVLCPTDASHGRAGLCLGKHAGLRNTRAKLVTRRLATTTWVVVGAFFVLALKLPSAAGQDSDLDVLLGQPETEGQEPSKEGRPSSEPPAAEPKAAGKPEAEPQAASIVSEPESRRVIEEIIVTAQKRQETLHEVPISISVLDDEFLSQQSITDLQELAHHVPNVKIDTAGGFWIQPRIRGFSTDPFNRGFEQAVGLVIDGVPYRRGEYFLGALLDLDRVEVLRGPQGTLFGKNTTVGLLNLATKKPTDELTGFINLEAGEFDRRRVEGALGGPLIKGLLNFRIAGLFDDRDGFVDNTTAALVPETFQKLGGRRQKGLRFKLDFPDLLGANLILGYERFEPESTGAGQELRLVPENLRPFFLQFDPDTDFEPENYVGSINARDAWSQSIDTFVANASYDLGGWGLAAVAGWSMLETKGMNDGDISPLPIITIALAEKVPQTTFELRLTSPNLPGLFGLDRPFGLALGGSDFIAGLFYQRGQLQPSRITARVNAAVLASWIAFQNNPDPATLPSTPRGLQLTENELGTEIYRAAFRQTSDAMAVYGQGNWHFADRWTFISGARFSYDRKKAGWVTDLDPDNAPFLVAAGAEEFTQNLTRSEFEFAPKLSMKYDWSDDITSFAGWAMAFRGGGFNNFTFSPDREVVEFDSETVTSWEVGTKMNLLDGAAQLDLGLFRMNLTDFQLVSEQSTIVADLPIVVNAGEARSQGVEADLRWLPATWLSVRGSLGFDDTQFLEFPDGDCEEGFEDTDGDGNPRCDLSGRSLSRAPKWTSTVTGNVTVPLASIAGDRILAFSSTGIDLISGLTVEYQDTQYLRRTLDPRTRSPSFFKLNANIGFMHPGQGWSLGLTAQNLLDQFSANRVEGVTSGTGVFSQFVDPPRVLFGTFRWSF